MLIIVISNLVRKYTFAYIFLFSHNVIVNMYINVYFISVRELQNTLVHYIQQTQSLVGQDLDQSSHELRLVPEGLIVRQLESVLNLIHTQYLAVIAGSGERFLL